MVPFHREVCLPRPQPALLHQLIIYYPLGFHLSDPLPILRRKTTLQLIVSLPPEKELLSIIVPSSVVPYCPSFCIPKQHLLQHLHIKSFVFNSVCGSSQNFWSPMFCREIFEMVASAERLQMSFLVLRLEYLMILRSFPYPPHAPI